MALAAEPACLADYFLCMGDENLYLYALILALALDFILGDPPVAWHPVRVLGNAAARLEKISRTFPFSPLTQGILFMILCVFSALVPVGFMTVFSGDGLPGILVRGLLIYFALGGTCLARETARVGSALEDGGPEAGRERVAMLVSRDTNSMDEKDVVSAAIETLAENFSDSACATLFYAALGGPVLAWLHRTVNTLDAMVGYKTSEYAQFGRASARFDDLLNLLPARISAVVTALVSPTVGGDVRVTLDCVRASGSALESPNAGYPIAAFAGALRVTLCGPSSYFGEIKEKPYIGSGPRPGAACLRSSLALYWNAYALAGVLALCLAGLMTL